MKKIYLLLAGLAPFAFASAQTFVSTEVENKNVVLEEFTGIYCGWCPDGHKLANQLQANNPKDVILINIHASTTYAQPKAGSGHQDYRTTYGNGIAAAAGVSSFPSGQLNRNIYTGTKAPMSRSLWATYASSIMSETSPVNVDFQAKVDPESRELTVVTEVYYTGDAPGSSNYLNIALLQDNIVGYQSNGAALYPEMVNEDGTYNHHHMLRDLITGQWGEEIKEVSKGSFFTKTYTYKIPEAINGVPVVLTDLSIAAFVAESRTNILSGTSHHVEFPDEISADLAMEDKTTLPDPSDLCATIFQPAVKITNNGPQKVTAFEVDLELNGEIITQKFEGSLDVGASTEVSWGDVDLPGGNYTAKIASPTNIDGGKLIDAITDNSKAISVKGTAFNPDQFTGTTTITFKDGTTPKGVGYEIPEGLDFVISATNGSGDGNGAIRIPLVAGMNPTGKPARIMMGKFNVKTFNIPALTFDYAYSDGSRNGTPPTVSVEISHDCGDSWQTINTITCQPTGNPTDPKYYYLPTPTEYKFASTSLVGFSLKKSILRLSLAPGTNGNSLYIDNIRIVDVTTSIEDESISSLSVYPNPTTSNTTLNFNNVKTQNVAISIVNQVGQVVSTVQSKTMTEGNQKIILPTAELAKGVYFVRIATEKGNTIERLIVQ